MLDDAVAAFLESVPERAFDQPLIALLRASGFERIHLVHGGSEFGKDVIAQRDGVQWAFQSKTGDVGQGDFRGMTGQLDELRLYNLSHPEFRVDLPRRPVLVMTGRFKGNGGLACQEYQRLAAERDEPQLEVWAADALIGQLSGNPDAVLRGSVDGQLLSLLGAIDEQRPDIEMIEVFSRRWTSWEPERFAGLGIIEAAMACDRLRVAERVDLACQLALCAVRAAWAVAADEGTLTAGADAAGALFESYATFLWEECDDRLLREKGLVGYSGPSAWVTYAIRSVRICELLGLLGLRLRGVDDDEAARVADWVAAFIAAQPGSARPISDRYAVSLVPPALLLAAAHGDSVRDFLRQATIWLCDRYERGELGLAAMDANPTEEMERIFGASLDYVGVPRRNGSQLAAVLLDLAALLAPDLYDDIRNDTLAVDLYPTMLRPGGGPDRLLRTGLNSRWDHSVDYVDEIGEGTAAPHLAELDDAAQEVSGDRWWDLLAISAALRDRHFPETILAGRDAAGVETA